MKDATTIFKALADGTRLRIMALLLHKDELCVCDITTVLELPQSTVSRHLGTLRGAGLVLDRRQGRWMYYRLRKESEGAPAGLTPLIEGLCGPTPQGENDRERLKEVLRAKAEDHCR